MFVMQGTLQGTEPLPQSVAEHTWLRRGCGMGYPLLSLQLHSQPSQNYAVLQVWLWSLLTVRPTLEPNQPLIPGWGCFRLKSYQEGNASRARSLINAELIKCWNWTGWEELTSARLPQSSAMGSSLAVANPVRAEMPPVTSSRGPLS